MNDHIIPLNYQSSAKNHQIGEESFQYEMPLKVKSKSKKKKRDFKANKIPARNRKKTYNTIKTL